MVYQGYHPFFNGMYEAYANHRPFVISPDMIWLLISQGFARHVNANAERLRSKFVNFSGKTNLVVYHNFKNLESPTNNWDTIIQEFTKKIDAHIGKDLVDILTSDFTTTTQNEKIASQITIMEATKPYFEYITITVVCGIPEVTLKGTTEDWEKVLNKTKKLAKYDLEWWTSELEPILEEFIDASKGKIHKKFWRNMFKVHTLKQYGNPEQIDGWIVKFFPYNKYGKQNNLKFINSSSTLPEEIVKVDLTFISKNCDSTITTPLELWAGFMGLEQNAENFALTPVIGWFIRKKEKSNDYLIQTLEFQAKSNSREGINIRVKELPTELLELKEINKLEVSFIDKIIIPEKLVLIKIQKLVLDGLINEAEIERIKKMFPNTFLEINGNTINNPYKNGK